MDSQSRLTVAILNFLILFWLFFFLQLFMKIGAEVKYLNSGVAVSSSALFTFIIWKQQVNFKPVLKYSLISWGVGLLSGIIFVVITDPHDAQGIFLGIFITGPIGYVLGMIISVFIMKMSVSIKTTKE